MRASKLFVTFLCVLLYRQASSQSDSTVYTLQQCVDAAIANNSDVMQRNFQMQSAEVNRSQAVTNLIPTLNGYVGHTFSQGRNIDPFTNTYANSSITSANYNLSSDVTIFNGFRLLHALKRYSLEYDATKMEWQQAKDVTTLSVMLAYLQVLNNEELLAQAQKQYIVTQKQVERMTVMNNEGAVSPSQLYDLKGQLASDNISITSARNSLNSSKLSLAQLMNVPYNANLKVLPMSAEQFAMDYGTSVDNIYETSLKELAMVKAVTLRKQSVFQALKATRGGLWPSLGLSGGLSDNYSSLATDATGDKIKYFDQIKNNYGTSFGIGLNIPILNNFYQRNQVRQAKISVKTAEFNYKTTLTQLRQAIEENYFNMTAALETYKSAAEQVTAFTESFHATEARFNAGAVNTVDYMVAKNNVDRANVNLITARYNYLFRTKILDYYQGRLIW
ncbi:MAG: TolC family protein [Chitinophagaceae bacterium]